MALNGRSADHAARSGSGRKADMPKQRVNVQVAPLGLALNQSSRVSGRPSLRGVALGQKSKAIEALRQSSIANPVGVRRGMLRTSDI